MKIPIPLEICEMLKIDRWMYLLSDNKKGLDICLEAANKQLEIIASSLVTPIQRARPIQQFKEKIIEALLEYEKNNS